MKQASSDVPASPWVLFIVIEVQPEHIEEFLMLVSEVIDQMRLEPTFISTVLSRDTDDPGRFALFEIWRDREEFFSVQLLRPYRQRYSERIGQIGKSSRQISEWQQIRADYSLRFQTIRLLRPVRQGRRPVL